MQEMREMKKAGHSIEQISAKLIRPQVGKGKCGKKKMRDSLVQKMKQKKLQDKKAKKSGKADEVEEVVCHIDILIYIYIYIYIYFLSFRTHPSRPIREK